MRPSIFFRRAAACLLAGILLLILSGCRQEEAEQAVLQENGSTFRIGVEEMPDSLNPFKASSRMSEEFFLLAYDPLWRINASGEPENCLVDSWNLSSDQLTWTIRIRKDVTFSDGTPLTAEDVKFTYDELVRGDTAYRHYFDGINAIRCPDSYTLIISTAYVKGDMQYMPVPILPSNIWGQWSGKMSEYDNGEMIGSGPFVLKEVQSGPLEYSWLFGARTNYFAGSPHLGEVKFIYYATATGASRAVSAGEPEVDAAVGLTDVQMATLEEVPGLVRAQAYLPGSQIWAIAFNTRSGVFQDVGMRQAVEYCTDRQSIVSMVAGESAMPGYSWCSPGVDYYQEVSGPREYNQSAALAVFNSLGYVDMDQDGDLEHIGTHSDLVFHLMTSSQDRWSSSAATILIDSLEHVGPQVVRHATDGPVTELCGPNDDWDMCMLSWRGNNNPVLAARQFYGSEDSLTGWSSESYMSTFGQMQVTLDRETVSTLAGQLQQTVYDECPYLIIGYQSDIQAMKEDGWTGYQDVLNQTGSIFFNGCYDAYMSLDRQTE